MTPARSQIPGLESENVTFNGIRLHYWVGGEPAGPPVLLWHGFLTTGRCWRHVAPALVDAGCAVLVPEMRGYGDSDKPAGVAGYDGRALAEEFRALVGQIGFGGGRPLTLVAHDMGAPPALLWAADHPAAPSATAGTSSPRNGRRPSCDTRWPWQASNGQPIQRIQPINYHKRTKPL